MHVASEPLSSVHAWDDDVRDRYDPDRKEQDFRDYEGAPDSIKEFYRQNHTMQTVESIRAKRTEFLPRMRRQQSMWDTLEELNSLVDDSDPDTDLSQIAHALQTAERIRSQGHPDWMVLTGLIHDTGKMLCFFGEPQWAVVGDTFPVGCAFSDTIVLNEYFAANPDAADPRYNTTNGMYEAGCGLRNVLMSWGHDEYIYYVVRESKLPDEALAMLRYHSFYPWHKDGAYKHLMDDFDHKMLPWVQEFNPFDLYSKSDEPPNVAELRPYYQGLIDKYLPATLHW